MPTNNMINNRLGNDLIFKSVTLSSNDILNGFTIPVPLIAAPGVGYVLQILNSEFILKFNSIAYAGGGFGRLRFTNGSSIASFSALTITASVSTQQGANANSGSITALENLAVEYVNLTAPFTTGDSTARIDLSYQILRIG
jgi:hypothetical protein